MGRKPDADLIALEVLRGIETTMVRTRSSETEVGRGPIALEIQRGDETTTVRYALEWDGSRTRA